MWQLSVCSCIFLKCGKGIKVIFNQSNIHGELKTKFISENASHHLPQNPLLSRPLLRNPKIKIKHTIDSNFMLFHMGAKLVSRPTEEKRFRVRMTGFLDFVQCPVTFRKLDVSVLRKGGRHILCWVPYKELTSITG
jgi:hypothetical protein